MVENDSCKELGMKSAWHCPLLWPSSYISEVYFASFISWGHLLVPSISRLHRLFSRLCHFITLKLEPHHLPSKWCSFISCLQKLDNVTFLRHLKLVLHFLSSKGMFMQCQSLGISLHFQHLVGISEILRSSYSAIRP